MISFVREWIRYKKESREDDIILYDITCYVML